tara:strand:+ start:278 stop:502 length:225 start_codon:yes stop_codon:yes gene_type:complete
MKISQFNKLILRSIEEKKVKNLSKLEWDSLSHLNILTELEKKFPKKITSIKGIAELNNYRKLINILTKKKIIEK